MLKAWQTFFTIVFTFLLFTTTVFADFTFSLPKTNIDADEEIEATVNLSLQNQGNKTYYLEGAFKKEGGDYYFGQTWNDTDWVGYTATNADKSLKSITTSAEGTWSGTLKIKLDTTSSQFTGSGNYILKINRFTLSGSSPTPSDDQDTLVVTASSTPTPTSTPTDSPTPTATSTPTPTPTTTPTATKTPTPTKRAITDSPTITIPPDLLGVSTTQTPTPSATPSATQNTTHASIFSVKNLFFAGGGIVLLLTGILFYTFIVKNRL
ncbi:hypothetical protein HY385_02460 [Candidatus Daviesbacteria bacterium]|nr:hypothetical protein [Candidatus Daviesbacteria bacterium]